MMLNDVFMYGFYLLKIRSNQDVLVEFSHISHKKIESTFNLKNGETYEFNPTEENTWWLGVAYWAYGEHLSQGSYNTARLRKSVSSYLSAIACFKTIKMRYEAAQQEIQKLRQNIRHVRWRLEYNQ